MLSRTSRTTTMYIIAYYCLPHNNNNVLVYIPFVRNNTTYLHFVRDKNLLLVRNEMTDKTLRTIKMAIEEARMCDFNSPLK